MRKRVRRSRKVHAVNMSTRICREVRERSTDGRGRLKRDGSTRSRPFAERLAELRRVAAGTPAPQPASATLNAQSLQALVAIPATACFCEPRKLLAERAVAHDGDFVAAFLYTIAATTRRWIAQSPLALQHSNAKFSRHAASLA